MGVAYRTGAMRVRSSPREPALRKARVCYDHSRATSACSCSTAWSSAACSRAPQVNVTLTSRGDRFCRDLGIDVSRHGRPAPRSCAAHASTGARAGIISPVHSGAAMLHRFIEIGWAKRARDSRVVHFTPAGEAKLREHFAP